NSCAFLFQAEDGIRDRNVTGVQTCALPIFTVLLNNINIYESREKFMQLTIQKKDLLESIQKVSAAISSRTAIPILTGMKMDVTTDGVALTGSDSDITIQSHIHVEKNVATNDEGQVIKETIITDITPGSIVLPGPHFPEIITKLPEDQVHITVD